MINVSHFDLNFFSRNPKIIDNGNRLMVRTSLWRSSITLFSGYRCLIVNPEYSELILYNRLGWLHKYMSRISYNQIRMINSLRFIHHIDEHGEGGNSTCFHCLWHVRIELENKCDMLPLFCWEKDVGRVPYTHPHPLLTPSFAYENANKSQQQKDYDIFVFRLSELTGKDLN